ncbi:hypothetical protein Tsubulata_038017, partial [Turnera subulata]
SSSYTTDHSINSFITSTTHSPTLITTHYQHHSNNSNNNRSSQYPTQFHITKYPSTVHITPIIHN